ncbi:MAG: hypothetical protein ACLVEU_04835 [Bacteroides cellulosilyticus]
MFKNQGLESSSVDVDSGEFVNQMWPWIQVVVRERVTFINADCPLARRSVSEVFRRRTTPSLCRLIYLKQYRRMHVHHSMHIPVLIVPDATLRC